MPQKKKKTQWTHTVLNIIKKNYYVKVFQILNSTNDANHNTITSFQYPKKVSFDEADDWKAENLLFLKHIQCIFISLEKWLVATHLI